MADVTSSVRVTIDSIEIINRDGEPVAIKSGSAISEDPNDYSPKVKAQSTNHMIIHAELEKTDGTTFQDGDEIKIPTRCYAETGSRVNTALAPNDWTNLSGSSGVVGQWQVGGPGSSTTKPINIKLNSLANGQAVLSNVTMDLGTKGITCWGVGFDIVAKFQLAGTMFGYGMTARDKTIYRDSTFQSESANNLATVGIRTGVDLYNELINTRGASGTKRKVVAEALYENSTSIDMYRTTFANACPYSLTEAEGCFVTDYLTPNFTASWTALTPNSGESLSAFKTRVMSSPMQYGFYNDSSGTHVVYYIGEIGTDTPEWTEYRTDDLPSVIAEAMIEQGWYRDTDETALTNIYRKAIEDNTIVGKHITANHFAMYVNYETVLEDTEYPYSVKMTYDPGTSSETVKNFSGTIKLTGAFGSVVVRPFSAAVMKYDDETKTPLAGAKIKLQIQRNGAWTDYASAKTTDSTGVLTFENLALGTYRAVETQAPSGYDLTKSPNYDSDLKAVVSESFTIASTDTEGAKVQMANIQNIQEAEVIYKEITWGDILRTDTFYGMSGTPMEYDAQTVINQYIEDGYSLVASTYKQGTLFDNDKDTIQTFVVDLRKVDDMANVDCSACTDLKEFAPEFVQSGVTTTVCNSLKNDTGLNPRLTTLHNDCDDLDTANDCLVGMMDNEIEAYDVCDWKKFMHKFIPNIHQLTKAEICTICGLWTSVHDLSDRLGDMCELLNNVVTPSLAPYGILPLADTSYAQARRCGTATDKVIQMPDDGSLNPYTKTAQNIGISYASMVTKKCDSEQEEMIEWVAPSHYMYKLASGAASGDVLWKVTEAQAKSVIGISDYLWETFTHSSWTWHQSSLSPSRQMAQLTLCIGRFGLASNEMGIVFEGCNAPNDPITADQVFGAFNTADARSYRHNV